MVVYHGSNSRFETLRINEKLVKSSATLLNEGIGIYISLNKSVAASYGKYLYTLEIDDKYLMDFRKLAVIKKYLLGVVKQVKRESGIDILRYVNLEAVANSLLCGQVAISGTCREISLLLDSNEYWYQVEQKKIEQVYKLLESYDKKHLTAYLFNYNIEKIGVIKKLALGTEGTVKILKREKIA